MKLNDIKNKVIIASTSIVTMSNASFVNAASKNLGDEIVKGVFGDTKVLSLINMVLTLIAVFGGAYFVVKAVMATIGYFNTDDSREQKEQKGKIKNALIGTAICLVAGVIIRILISGLIGQTI